MGAETLQALELCGRSISMAWPRPAGRTAGFTTDHEALPTLVSELGLTLQASWVKLMT